MPQLQTVDLSPTPYQGRETPIEKAAERFSDRFRSNQIQKQDSDELSKIYKQYQDDGRNIGNALMSLQTNPNLSPTRRVEAANQMLKFQQHNNVLQKQASKELAAKTKADKEAADAQEKLETNKQYLAELEQDRGLEPGSLAKYEKQPGLADKLHKPVKGNQADREVDPEQLQRIEHTVSQPGFKDLSPA